jgi:Tfp pilus assembly protein PilF
VNSKSIGIICVLLAAAVFVVYGGVGSHSFLTYDDDEYVTANALAVEGLTEGGVRNAFTVYTAGNWHPVTMLSHMLDCDVLGLHAGRHIVENVVLHAATCVLLFLFLLRLTHRMWPSCAVAVLFAVHPLNVESVAWVSQRKSVLSGLFFVLGLHAYVWWVRARPSYRPWAYSCVMLAFLLGLLSKPMVVTFPLILLLLDVWPLRRLQGSWESARVRVTEKVPLLVLSAAVSVVTIRAQSAMEAVATRVEAPLLMRLPNAVCSYSWYLWKAAFPVGLGVFYPFPQGVASGLVLGSALLLVCATLAAWFFRLTRPYVLFGWCWYSVMLIPVIGLIQVGGQAHADRYAYLPLIGVFTAVVWLVSDAVRPLSARARRSVAAIAVGFGTVYGLLTMRQVARWRDGVALFRHSLRVCGDSTVLRNNLGTTLLLRGKPYQAMEQFGIAVALDPSYGRGHNNLGNCLNQLGRPREAIPHLRRALDLMPDALAVKANLGTALIRTGQFTEGIAYLESAARGMQLFAHSYAELADAYVQTGDFAHAATNYRRALELRPELHEARRRLNAIRARILGHEESTAE